MKSSQRSGVLAFLLMGALVSAPVEAGQDRTRGQQEAREAKAQKEARGAQAQKERGAAEAQRDAAQGRGEAAREAAGDARGAAARGGRFSDRSPEELARFRKFLREEAGHRQRIARLDRLRDLADRKKDTERLGQLRELRAKEQQRYEAAMARYREQMGDEDYRAALAFIEKFSTPRGRQKLQEMRDAAKGGERGDRR